MPAPGPGVPGGGHQHVQKWIDSSRAGIRTAFAARVADAALAGSTMAWHDQAGS
ncbi:hypothetical protein ACO229_03155 [Promicromonospora sp. MS192]|uniref:hypothetical protein n=1 Tax=Promicromonospora sp. MS192 TaxID=3412684 RepID=UPI003C2FC9D9